MDGRSRSPISVAGSRSPAKRTSHEPQSSPSPSVRQAGASTVSSASSRLEMLPPELVVYLVRFVPLQGVLSLSETCSSVHTLIEDPLGSRSLWRALYLDTFDDSRSSASHRRQTRADNGRPLPEIKWRDLLRTCTVSLRRAERARWGQPSSQGDDQHLASLQDTFDCLLYLLNTSASPPLPSLNLLALSLIDATTFPIPPSHAPLSLHQSYHQLRARLLDSTRHPISQVEVPAAMRRVWQLARSGGLFAQDRPDWAVVEAVKRMMDRARSAAGGGSGPDGEAFGAAAEVGEADWAGLGGAWKTVAILDAKPAMARAWRERVAHLNEGQTLDDADLLISHLPNARFVLPDLSLAHVSSTLDTPTTNGGNSPDLAPPLAYNFSSPGLSSPLPIADVRLRLDSQTVRVAFSLAGEDIWHGIVVDQVDGGRAIYGTVSRTVGEIAYLFAIWR